MVSSGELFRSSFAAHSFACVGAAALHGIQALDYPGTGHAVIATTFAVAALRRLQHQFAAGNIGRRLFARDAAILAITCPLSMLLSSRRVPLSLSSYLGMCFGYAIVNFFLVSTSAFNVLHKMAFVLGHALVVPLCDPPAGVDRAACILSLLASMVVGLAAATAFREVLTQQRRGPGSPSSLPKAELPRSTFVGSPPPVPSPLPHRSGGKLTSGSKSAGPAVSLSSPLAAELSAEVLAAEAHAHLHVMAAELVSGEGQCVAVPRSLDLSISRSLGSGGAAPC